MGAIVLHRLQMLGLFAQRLGPYALIELVLPGGTLIALLLFAWRRRHEAAAGRASPLAVVVDALVEFGRALADRIPLYGTAAWVAGGRERDGLEPLAMAPG